MYISKVVSNYIFFWGIWGYLRYLTGRANVRSGMHLLRQISVGHLSGRGNVHRGCVWSGNCPSVMCLVREVSVGDVSGWGNIRRECVWLGKCPSGMCLVGEVSVGDVPGQGNVCRGSVRRGRVRRWNVRRGCARKSLKAPIPWPSLPAIIKIFASPPLFSVPSLFKVFQTVPSTLTQPPPTLIQLTNVF